MKRLMFAVAAGIAAAGIMYCRETVKTQKTAIKSLLAEPEKMVAAARISNEMMKNLDSEAIKNIVSSGMSRAKSEKLITLGRNLFTAITAANVEREAVGLANLWPHTSEEDGLTGDEEDIAGKKFSSATAYFKALFDVGGDRPYVDADKACAMSDGKAMWCVAQGIADEMPDNVPVLISANFDCSALPLSWTGSETNAGRPITIGSSGETGDSAIVVICKSGRVKVLKRDEITLRGILGDAPIDMMPRSWLEPDGVKNANGK